MRNYDGLVLSPHLVKIAGRDVSPVGQEHMRVYAAKIWKNYIITLLL